MVNLERAEAAIKGHRGRGVIVRPPASKWRRSGSLKGDLEAVKNCGERGTTLGLGPWMRRLERSRNREAAGSRRLMTDRD